MCGRYELHSHPATIALTFGLAHVPEVMPRYNIAPTTEVPVVRMNADGQRELVRLRWGLVPRWARDPAIGLKLINARGETLAEKPSFRMALRRHRCLLPADGFYEWMPVPATNGTPAHKQPMHVGMKNGSLFGLAGLYERWRSPDGAVVDSCTVITTAANAAMLPIHDRMPLIIAPDQYDRWLDPAHTDLLDLIVPFPATAMAFYPVSTRVNAVAHDDSTLIKPVAAPTLATSRKDAGSHPAAPEQESLF